MNTIKHISDIIDSLIDSNEQLQYHLQQMQHAVWADDPAAAHHHEQRAAEWRKHVEFYQQSIKFWKQKLEVNG